LLDLTDWVGFLISQNLATECFCLFPIQKQNQARYCHKTSDSSNSNCKQTNFPNLNLQYPIRYNDWPVPRWVFELSHLFYKKAMKKSGQFRKPLRCSGYEVASFFVNQRHDKLTNFEVKKW